MSAIDKRNGECSCHNCPPCPWCESLDEKEAEVYWSGGRAALEALWATRDECLNGPEFDR